MMGEKALYWSERREAVLERGQGAFFICSHLGNSELLYCKQKPYQWYNFFDFWARPVSG